LYSSHSCTYNSWHVYKIDINNAFLYGELQKDVYMVQPHGFEVAYRILVYAKSFMALNKLIDLGSLS